MQLASKMVSQSKGKGKQGMSDALDANWEEIYALADLVADRHERTGTRRNNISASPTARPYPHNGHAVGDADIESYFVDPSIQLMCQKSMLPIITSGRYNKKINE